MSSNSKKGPLLSFVSPQHNTVPLADYSLGEVRKKYFYFPSHKPPGFQNEDLCQLLSWCACEETLDVQLGWEDRSQCLLVLPQSTPSWLQHQLTGDSGGWQGFCRLLGNMHCIWPDAVVCPENARAAIAPSAWNLWWKIAWTATVKLG